MAASDSSRGQPGVHQVAAARSGYQGHVNPIDGTEGGAGENLSGWPIRRDTTFAQQENAVCVARGEVEVVKRDDGDQVSRPGHSPDELHHLELPPKVEGARRFVEQHEPGISDQGLGDGHELLLATAQMLDIATAEIIDPELGKSRFGGCNVRGIGVPAPPALLASKEDDLEDGQNRPDGQMLRDIAHPPYPLARGKRRQILAVQHHLAATVTHEPRDAPKERRLSGRVRSDEGRYLPTRRGCEAKILDDPLPAIGRMQSRDPEAHRMTPRRTENTRLRKNGIPTSEVMMLMG